MKIVNAHMLAGKILDRDYRDEKKIKEITIHRQTQADGKPWESVTMFSEWIRDPSNKWGTRLFPYHYYIDQNGHVFNVLPLSVRGMHAAGRNTRSIGIALAVDGRKQPPSEAQWKSLQELCRFLLKLMPQCVIHGHSKLKRCPGKFVDIKRLRLEVKDDKRCRTCGRASST